MLQATDDVDAPFLSHVRPRGWTNPEPAATYRLVVVGGGAAGLTAAHEVARRGGKVAIIERHRLGGQRLACDAVLQALSETARSRSGSFESLTESVQRRRLALARDASAWRLTAGAVDVFFGTAKFTGPTSIVVDDTPLSFSRAVIAAGTSLIEPKIDGLKTVGYRTLDTLGEMPRLPRRLAVLGDDPQGAAAAQVMRRLGCEVHLITMLPTLLPGEEPEIDEWLARQLAHDGVHLHLTAIVRRIEQTGQSKGLLIERDGAKRKILVDEILVVGRHRPNLDDLAVGAAGIRFNADAIVVSPSMQTANSAVFAAGAACGCGDSALAAEASAGVAVQSALGPRRERFELSNVPRVLLTNPQVARLGLTFREALARGGEVESRRIILTDGESNGLLLLHRDRRTDRLLGATIVASNAAARLAPLVLAAAEGLPLAKAGVLDASAV